MSETAANRQPTTTTTTADAASKKLMASDDPGRSEQRRIMALVPTGDWFKRLAANGMSFLQTGRLSGLPQSSDTIDKNNTIGIAQNQTSACVSAHPRRAACTAWRDGFMSKLLYDCFHRRRKTLRRR